MFADDIEAIEQCEAIVNGINAAGFGVLVRRNTSSTSIEVDGPSLKFSLDVSTVDNWNDLRMVLTAILGVVTVAVRFR